MLTPLVKLSDSKISGRAQLLTVPLNKILLLARAGRGRIPLVILIQCLGLPIKNQPCGLVTVVKNAEKIID